MRSIKVIIFSLLISIQSFADEGMWLPFLLQSLNEKEMRSMGMKISAKDIYDVNKGSLKDAIVQFGGGCTGEIISKEGLILTNHHCGFGSIQRLSSIQNNYINNGFFSKNKNEELAAPGLTVTFISSMQDVSIAILKNITTTLSETERQSQIDKNILAYRTSIKLESYETLTVRPFYNGNMYVAIVSVVYNDIRLVAAPPESIGAYGKDTDNWVWPRHAADFSIFRIYAGADNKPAAYNPNNKPFIPKKYLNISLKGIKEGDFTMVFGFPGRTNEYLPSEAVRQTLETTNPIKIEIRDAVLATQKQLMQQDATIKLQYASKYAGIANAWKKWIGENLGLQRSGAVQKKVNYEKTFTQKLNANAALKNTYGNVLTDLNNLYKEAENSFYVRDAFNETMSNCEILSQGLQLTSFANLAETSDDETVNKEKVNLAARMKIFYKDYNAKVDEQVLAKVLKIYFTKVNAASIGTAATEIWNNYNKDAEAIAKDIFTNSFLINESKFASFLANANGTHLGLIKADKAFILANALRNGYVKNIATNVTNTQALINTLQRQYMDAQMKVMGSQKKFYPDANSTLRVTYGKVKGYAPRDGAYYNYYTYLDGVMEKYVPNDYEFDVPKKLQDLYAKKDYGQYGVNGKMPVCFIAANHTTGGNSGSPALDAYGNLIGLNFDRAWEGTMSDINYDPSICRNIMVDARYVLFILDKFGGSGHLLKEMTLVK
jgi:hypothetical protein